MSSICFEWMLWPFSRTSTLYFNSSISCLPANSLASWLGSTPPSELTIGILPAFLASSSICFCKSAYLSFICFCLLFDKVKFILTASVSDFSSDIWSSASTLLDSNSLIIVNIFSISDLFFSAASLFLLIEKWKWERVLFSDDLMSQIKFKSIKVSSLWIIKANY